MALEKQSIHEILINFRNLLERRDLGAEAIDAKIDSLLGINFSDSENSISDHRNSELYTQSGLNPSALNTGYWDCQQIIEALPKDTKLIDWGAGYGRLGLTNIALGSPIQYRGYEYLKERIASTSWIFKKSFP